MPKNQTVIYLCAKLPFTTTKRTKWYLSSCPVLDVHSQGSTKKEAINNLKEALSLFFVSCYERGTLGEVMKECGFVGGEIEQKCPTKLPRNYLDVPIPFLLNKSKQPHVECHA